MRSELRNAQRTSRLGMAFTPEGQAALNAAAEERIRQAQMDNMWVPYPAADRIVDYMERLIATPDRGKMATLLVTSEANNGKTAVAERFRERPLRRPFEAPADGAGQVLYVYAPPTPNNPQRFLDDILLFALGEHFRKEAVDHKIDRIARGFERAGTKILVIDDIHHVLLGNPNKQKTFFELVYKLKHQLGFGLVLVGMPNAVNLVGKGGLEGYEIKHLDLPLWRYGKTFLSFLEGIKKNIPFEVLNLTGKTIATEIFQLSEGLVGEITAIIKEATITAIMSGSKKITLREIQESDYVSPAESRTLVEKILSEGVGQAVSSPSRMNTELVKADSQVELAQPRKTTTSVPGPVVAERRSVMSSDVAVAPDLQDSVNVICRMALADPLKVVSFESFRSMCRIKYEEASMVTFKANIGSQGCSTGLAIKQGRRTTLPDNVGLIESIGKEDVPQEKPDITKILDKEALSFTPSHLNLKPIPSEKLHTLTLRGLRDFFVLPLMTPQKKGLCPGCQRDWLVGQGYGICGRCYGLARNLQGIAMLQALDNKVAEDKEHPGMRKGAFGRLVPISKWHSSEGELSDKKALGDDSIDTEKREGGEEQEIIKESTALASVPPSPAAPSAEVGAVEVTDNQKLAGLVDAGVTIAIRVALGLDDKTPLHELPVHIDRLIAHKNALVEQRDRLQEDFNEQSRQLRVPPGYELLSEVLRDAFEHAVNDKPFNDHTIMRETQAVGLGFPAGLARNKIQEAVGRHEEQPEKAITDLFEAIKDIAAIVVALREGMLIGRQAAA